MNRAKAVMAAVFGMALHWQSAFAACSPIVVDLNRDGIKLGPAGVGVYFDVNADGVTDHVQWVRRQGDEAFLVADHNGNGIVDDGSELFGMGTALLLEGGTAPNGFVGLAQYDSLALGGNDDGLITREDSIWPKLHLWIDSDADGVSTTTEIRTPQDLGLTAFETIPKSRRYTDAAGNIIPFFAWATFGKLHKKTLMVDVFFVQLPK